MSDAEVTRSSSSGGVRWKAAWDEADSALACLQVGSLKQAGWHLTRSRWILDGDNDSPPEEPELLTETNPAGGAGDRTGGADLTVAARLRAHVRQLRAHGDSAAAAGEVGVSGFMDSLGKRERVVVGAAFLVALALASLLHKDSGDPGAEPEPRPGRQAAAPANLKLTMQEVRQRFAPGTTDHRTAGYRFTERVVIKLDRLAPALTMSVALFNTDIYRVTLSRKGQPMHSFVLGPRVIPGGLCTYSIDLRGTDAVTGVDSLEVEGVDGEGVFELGPVSLMDWVK